MQVRSTLHSSVLMFTVALSAATLSCTSMSEDERRQISYGIKTVTPDMRNGALKRREQYLTRARAGRAQLETWARAHQNDLALLKQDPLTDEVLRNVFYKLPDRPSKAGIKRSTLSDPEIGREDFRDVTKIIFWWRGPVGKTFYLDPYLKKEAVASRDLPLAESTASGKSKIILWASGRITENTFVENLPYRSGQPSLRWETTEIEPPFDFLR